MVATASAWEDQVERDAETIDKFILNKYQAGDPIPLSIAVIAKGTDIHRERVAAALAKLVFKDQRLRVGGKSPARSVFFPRDVRSIGQP